MKVELNQKLEVGDLVVAKNVKPQYQAKGTVTRVSGDVVWVHFDYWIITAPTEAQFHKDELKKVQK